MPSYSKTMDRYCHRRRVRSRVDAERGRGRRGKRSLASSLLRLPDEVLLEIIGFLPMLQVSRLSQVCTRLSSIIGADVWKRGVFAPSAGDYIYLLRHQRYAGVKSLILSGFDGEALRYSLEHVRSHRLSTLRFVMISGSCISQLGVQELVEVVSEMDCVQLEGGSLCADKIKSFFDLLKIGHKIDCFIVNEQRLMSVVPVGTLISVVGSMSEISLPYFGSTVDGISTNQFLGIMINPGKLERMRLVSHWDVGVDFGCFEVAGFVYNLAEQRRGILNEVWRAEVIREQCMGGYGEDTSAQTVLRVQHTCFIRFQGAGEGVNDDKDSVFALNYTVGEPVLSSVEMRSRMEDLCVPGPLLAGLAEMCWSNVCSAQAARLDWLEPFAAGDFRMVPAMSPDEDVWNVPYLGNFIHYMLPVVEE